MLMWKRRSAIASSCLWIPGTSYGKEFNILRVLPGEDVLLKTVSLVLAEDLTPQMQADCFEKTLLVI
ncbi:hypothetical protein N7490_005020 [Penicillium lividum]|nr:hypothetical protein N7490_005020 [Penicillium lividum]